MDFYRQIGMYFFTLGALLSILAGAFTLEPLMYDLALMAIIFFGVFSAILNVSEEEELGFLVGSSAFLIAIISLSFLLNDHPIIVGLTSFFEVVTFFVGSMVAVVALRAVFERASQPLLEPVEHANEVDTRMDSLLFTQKERIWNFLIFLAVATTFIAVLLIVFFEFSEYIIYFVIFDLIITAIFFIDLIVLYKKEGRFIRFVKNCWPDIVATIPFWQVFRMAKLLRLFRIIRIAKLSKTMKFMSDKSGVKHYIHPKGKANKE